MKNQTKTGNPRVKIAIVDDNSDILEVLNLTLNDAGYQTCSTTIGTNAHDLILKHKPDAVILDVLLSGTDGRDICKKLKDDVKTKHIPVMMISAHPNVRQSVLSVGASGFIPKPFDIDELLSMVSDLTKS